MVYFFRLENRLHDCFFNCVVQAMTSLEAFCNDVKGDVSSATLEEFKPILATRVAGDSKGMTVAVRRFQEYAGTSIHADYLTDEQLDAQELLERIIQKVHREIQQVKVEMGLPITPSVVETHFSAEIDASLSCPEYATVLFDFKCCNQLKRIISQLPLQAQ